MSYTQNIDYSFTKQDCNLTLAEGLAEYYKLNPNFNVDGGLLGMSAEVVKAHDVAHIVFGLGTTSADELCLEIRTVFGCKITIGKYYEMVNKGFISKLLKTFGLFRLLRRLVLTLPRAIRILYLSLRMKKKWPHFEYERYLYTSLSSLREEFGIRL